jgi:alkanesulfonate monooxygenase SsuD/methylene tetrahydromethanopterin reductase-like flavin-dependent oxidoreductase (luciferase family)
VARSVTSLRLGVAGVLLRVHSPWAVAERWATVSHMTPAGLDLGLARGEVDAQRAHALRDGMPTSSPAEFEGRVAALLSYLQGDVGPSLQPAPAPDVEVWLHGRHHASAEIAQRFGRPYCHARFLGEPTPIPAQANAVAVAGVCARTDAQAHMWASRTLGEFRPTVVGDQQAWKRELVALREREGVPEIVFVDLCDSPPNHSRSIQLFSEVAASV